MIDLSFNRLVVRSIFLHDVGISAVFDNTLQTGGRGRRGAAATASSNSGRTPASHSPSPALSASQSGNSQASSSKSKASSKPTKKRSSTSTRPSFSKASSTAGSEDGSSAAASTPLSILPYKDLREGSPQTAPTDFLSAAASALPDVAVSHTSPPSSVYAGRTTRNSSSRVSSRHSSTDDAEDVTLVPFVPKASSSHAPESECQLPLASSSSSSSAMKSVPALSSLPLAFKDSPEMQEGLRQAELYKRRKLTSSSSSSSLKVKEEDFDQPIRSSLRNSSSSPNVRVEPEEDVKPVPHQAFVLSSCYQRAVLNPFFSIADFLNSLLPPTDSDHGLGDLCGKALFDIGFSCVCSFGTFVDTSDLLLIEQRPDGIVAFHCRTS